MHFFVNHQEKYILITNLKVMFSTLTKQTNLIAIPSIKLRKLLCKKFILRYKIFFLTRNPYSRIVSNYFDKFVYNPLVEHYEIQNCQKLFLKQLGIFRDHEELAITKEKLTTISFNEFVSNLKFVYKEDLHFAPQHMLKLGCNNQYDQIRENFFHKLDYQIVQMEDDIQTFLHDLKLNTNIHINKTKHEHFTDYFSSQLYNEVNLIYHKDFEYFDYQMIY
ncbi:sulfotransferase family 2 domain-containing protein [Fulvivirga sp. 29W222]|uniref:Sulfotransferase family 2 domain-containing protein n=1 Tax=Fulvivirga marina TaxID=2494733 RepID=A0A937KBL2_9BACT|nr:sulfotransferase family 2 domain-containing protein [Fulvivirga marina]MBL6446357.1 sulfotransferase family 2 domain-containing protein [Fulvivirga marina]